MANRTFPNNYFAWYNDDQRLAILCLDTTSVSTENTSEAYDTFQGDGSLSGTITDLDGNGSTATATDVAHGLATNDRITISGTTTYDGTYTITVTSADAFTFSHSGSTSDETGTWVSLFVDKGIRITYKAKYETASALSDDLDTDLGLDTSLHPALLNYLKYRLNDDAGSMEKSSHYKNLFDSAVVKQKSRKSGVRGLAVPEM